MAWFRMRASPLSAMKFFNSPGDLIEEERREGEKIVWKLLSSCEMKAVWKSCCFWLSVSGLLSRFFEYPIRVSGK